MFLVGKPSNMLISTHKLASRVHIFFKDAFCFAALSWQNGFYQFQKTCKNYLLNLKLKTKNYVASTGIDVFPKRALC